MGAPLRLVLSIFAHRAFAPHPYKPLCPFQSLNLSFPLQSLNLPPPSLYPHSLLLTSLSTCLALHPFTVTTASSPSTLPLFALPFPTLLIHTRPPLLSTRPRLPPPLPPSDAISRPTRIAASPSLHPLQRPAPLLPPASSTPMSKAKRSPTLSSLISWPTSKMRRTLVKRNASRSLISLRCTSMHAPSLIRLSTDAPPLVPPGHSRLCPSGSRMNAPMSRKAAPGPRSFTT